MTHHLLQSEESKDSSHVDYADLFKKSQILFCLSSNTPKTSPLSLSVC